MLPRVLILVAASFALAFGTVATTRTQSALAALPESAAAPANNPTTPEKVALGRLLFWDPLLSGNKDVACATCHHPDFAYADARDVSIGVNGIGRGAARHFAEGNTIPLVKRNSQTVLNSAFNGMDATGHYRPDAAPMFWDVRTSSLESQALEPLKALEEMRGTAYADTDAVRMVAARVAAIPEYRAMFTRAFGPATPIDGTSLSQAIAAFERSLTAANSPFDRYMRGDESAMTPQQVRGMRRFEVVGCANCHSGPMFSDFKTHVLGVRDNTQLPQSDTGVNGAYGFRTASLRNVALTAPYMHSGVLTSLNQVLNFYDNVRNGRGGGGRGGGRNGGNGNVTSRNPNVDRAALDPLLRQLNTRGNERDIVAFLDALTDTSFDKTIPERVPSGLKVGGAID